VIKEQEYFRNQALLQSLYVLIAKAIQSEYSARNLHWAEIFQTAKLPCECSLAYARTRNRLHSLNRIRAAKGGRWNLRSLNVHLHFLVTATHAR